MLVNLAFILTSSVCTLALSVNSGLTNGQLKSLQKKFASYYNTSSNSSHISVRGITIGGWLVTEPYITPTLFKNATSMATYMNSSFLSSNNTIIDEYTLCEALGYNTSKELLSNHYATWITEDDFKQISEDGFNLVRIPIGYWAYKVDHKENKYINNITFIDPYVGEGIQLKYLDKALEWAQKYGLNVWLDLHGAPGSQNGFDNSGQRIFYSNLGWLSKNGTRELTYTVWDKMFNDYLASNNSIVGVEIVNEPLNSKIGIDNITQAYYDAFVSFKETMPENDNSTFIIHDAFEGVDYFNLDFNPQYRNVSDQYANLTEFNYDAQNILVDHHHYEVFTDYQLAETQYARIMNIINYGESINEQLGYHPAVVGEWSGALTDCATWLNGVGVGARYDGSYYNTTLYTTNDSPVGNCTSQMPIEEWTSEYREQVRQFVEAQLATYGAKTTGWIFWNWKTENATEWDYLKLKAADLFPVPFDNYTYFNTNGNIISAVSASLSREAFPSSTSDVVTSTSTKSKNMANRAFHKPTLIIGTLSQGNTWKGILTGTVGIIAVICIAL
ncbi:hypothetical protein KAFR_0C05910 [Kazachstania africana CBS 2517]|uniref:Glycoside hydrolase family 5 domain-containing protein n=1 Tax=Kazachstania africana (strain ATCC 22294 / BCRC 22015 / CBS 2517 / CECT 1963 / NBRC 1671 / NRRL Y-8276) TaxID=1071382 RepID=H2AT82_KAZAF|nr:hypothetical protein KAFR_0C05910 [Kazachstania africana CBS 2517]CCF57582.1 hypothetical protein KAFR_0C05910 [Kazachstania africana CBS 2517]